MIEMIDITDTADTADRDTINLIAMGGVTVTRTPYFGQLGYEENGVKYPYSSFGQLGYEDGRVRSTYPSFDPYSSFGQLAYEKDDVRYSYSNPPVKLIIAPDVCVHMHRETVTIVEEETRKVIL